MHGLSLEYIKEKWQHAGFKKYLRNTGWMFGSRIINLFISLFTTVLVTRYLGPYNYGLISYAVSFVGLFSFISSLGLDQPLYQHLIRSPEDEKKLLGTSLIIRFFSSILALICTLTLMFIIPHEQILKIIITIVSTSFLFQTLSLFSYLFQSRVEAKIPSILTTVEIVLVSSFKIFVILMNKGVIFFSFVFAIDPFIIGVLLLIVYWKRHSIRGLVFDFQTAKILIKESLPLMFTSIFISIYSRIDQVMIQHMINSAAVGIYDAMVRVAEGWYFIPSILTTSFLPSVISKTTNAEMYQKRMISLTYLLLFISAVVCLVITLGAKYIVLILYGKEFISGVLSLQIYSWAGIGIAIGTIMSQHLINKNLSFVVLYSSIISMAINIGLNFFFIPKYGINGAAMATLISYMLVPLSALLFPKVRKSFKTLKI